ncbi:MAG: RDD family protein [Pseudomonadota bacterium]
MTQMMTNSNFNSLPDPDVQAEFYANVPIKRLFAWIADVFLVTLATLLAGVFTLGIGWLFFPLFYLGIDFAYRTLTLSSGSATFGMRLMAIEIRNSSGRRLDAPEAALHVLAYMVCTGFVLTAFASIAMMILGPRRQGLHDLVLGTAAINRPG